MIAYPVNTGGFIYVSSKFKADEVFTYNNSGDGNYHSESYIVSGSGKFKIFNQNSQKNDIFFYKKGENHDASFSKDLMITILSSTDSEIFTFHPLPSTKTLKVEYIKDAAETLVTGNNKTLVCITGDISVDGADIKPLQFAKITRDIRVTTSKNSVVAIVEEL